MWKKSDKKVGIFIGRFQPFHKGHVQVVKRALKRVDKLYVIIGSTKQRGTYYNPFTATERKTMIEKCGLDITVVNVHDVYDDRKWMSIIQKRVPCPEVVYTGNPHVTFLFENIGIPVVKVRMHKGISASKIRELIAIGRKGWVNLVPKCVAAFIYRNGGIKRIRTAYMRWESYRKRVKKKTCCATHR